MLDVKISVTWTFSIDAALDDINVKEFFLFFFPFNYGVIEGFLACSYELVFSSLNNP